MRISIQPSGAEVAAEVIAFADHYAGQVAGVLSGSEPADAIRQQISAMMAEMEKMNWRPVEAAQSVTLERLLLHAATAQGLIGAVKAMNKHDHDRVDQLLDLSQQFLSYIFTDIAAMTHLACVLVETTDGETLDRMLQTCRTAHVVPPAEAVIN